MFDRFTDGAKRAMSRSRMEALRLRHEIIGVHHLALGLLREPDRVVAGILGAMGIELRALCAAIDAESDAPGDGTEKGALPFTPSAKRALEFCMEEATARGDRHLDTDHLLLGVVRAAGPELSTVFGQLQVTIERLRQAQDEWLGKGDSSAAPYWPPTVTINPPTAGDPVDHALHDMQQALHPMIDEATAEQRFDAASELRELYYRVKQARERLWYMRGGDA